jgi:hypothetical protein
VTDFLGKEYFIETILKINLAKWVRNLRGGEEFVSWLSASTQEVTGRLSFHFLDFLHFSMCKCIDSSEFSRNTKKLIVLVP